MNNRKSVATIQNPEFINLQPMDINPLMSACEVKVMYIGQNRNGSYVNKEAATRISKTLRGCPIVGHYIQEKQDFGDHGREVVINSQGVKENILTKPYGFISPDAKVWFQFFEDTDEFGNTVLREYLMTQAYLWTGQFEECKRVIENHNPQSMELDDKTLDGHWATDVNRGVEFFIINDAIFSKLCILGEDVEPCFEGASFVETYFSNNKNFMLEFYSMFKELKNTLNNFKGGTTSMGNEGKFTSLENENTIISAPVTNFEDGGGEVAPAEGEASTTPAEGAEDAGTETPTTPPASEGNEDESTEGTEPEGVVLNDTDKELIKTLPESYAPEGETVIEALINDGATNVPSKSFKKEDKEDDKDDDDSSPDNDDKDDDEDEKKKNFKCGEDDDKKKKFSLEQEMAELKAQFAALQEENRSLLAFKQKVEDEEKDALIASFYMLSDEDKKDIIANKANYSLREIKAELSMICVDKKVSFSQEENEKSAAPLIYNLESHQASNLPTWLQAVENVRQSNNN